MSTAFFPSRDELQPEPSWSVIIQPLGDPWCPVPFPFFPGFVSLSLPLEGAVLEGSWPLSLLPVGLCVWRGASANVPWSFLLSRWTPAVCSRCGLHSRLDFIPRERRDLKSIWYTRSFAIDSGSSGSSQSMNFSNQGWKSSMHIYRLPNYPLWGPKVWDISSGLEEPVNFTEIKVNFKVSWNWFLF